MQFTTASAVAVLAFTASAAAEPQPYRLAVMPGLSLMRRDTNGYKPETSNCGTGNTCAEACGAGFDQCASNDGVAHCFNPAAKQNCCSDGSGNSCDAGYYCSQDTTLNTWCCPEGMDLAACAAAYTISGGLHTVAPTSSTPTPTPSSTSTPIPTPVVTKTDDVTTTFCPSSSGYTTAWTGSNSTISSAAPTQPTVVPITTPATVPTGTSGAAATGVSALLLVAAGFVALL